MITERLPQPSRSALIDLKERHEWRVVELLRDVGEVSRAELVAMTGLSRTTVANLVGALIERGLVDESVPGASSRVGRGRNGANVRLRSDAGVALGVAISREHIRVAAVDLAATVLAVRQAAIAPETDGVATVEAAARVVREVLAEVGKDITRVVGVGLGLPGPVDAERGRVDGRATVRRWAGINARDELSRRLGGAHVFPDNECNFGALGELQHGAGRGVEDLFYVSVGTGIGAGLVIDGRLYRGNIGYAGEVGHVSAYTDSEPCTCGRRGCLSMVATSWAVIARLTDTHGPDLTIERVLSLAADRDPHATAALHDAGTHTARALNGAISALNPAVVVIGGDIGAYSPTFLAAFSTELAANMLETTVNSLRVVHAALGDRSHVLGATTRVLRDTDCVRAFMVAASAA